MLNERLLCDRFMKVPIIVIVERDLVRSVSPNSKIDWSTGYVFLCNDDVNLLNTMNGDSFLTGDADVLSKDVLNVEAFDTFDCLANVNKSRHVKFDTTFTFINHLHIEEELVFSYRVSSTVKNLCSYMIEKICTESNLMVKDGIEIVSWSVISDSIMCLQTSFKLPMAMSGKLLR
jgi:hypothetical protein